MYSSKDLKKEVYKLGEVAKFVGVTNGTLRRWENLGRVKFSKTDYGTRSLTKDKLIELLKANNLWSDEIECLQKKDVIYCRVSSHDQKKYGDLDRQIQFLIKTNNDLINPVILSEVGSGLNDKRKQLQKLLRMVLNNEVSRIFITYEDRLTRFGFEYLRTMCEMHETKIIVVKDVDVKKSIEQELMEDIMSLMASFSGKLYGMRSKKNKIIEKKGKINGNEGNKKIVTEHLKELRTVDELEDLIGKEKLVQFFVEHYLEKVKEDLPEPDFDIEDIMK